MNKAKRWKCDSILQLRAVVVLGFLLLGVFSMTCKNARMRIVSGAEGTSISDGKNDKKEDGDKKKSGEDGTKIKVKVTAEGGQGEVPVAAGADVKIVWTSENADDCIVYPFGWTGKNGEHVIEKIKSSVTVLVVCTGNSGKNSDSVQVTAKQPPAPDASITANGVGDRLTVGPNDTVTIAWTSTNTTSCDLRPTGNSGLSGTVSLPKPIQSQVIVLHCTGPGGDVIDFVVVQLNPGASPAISADLRVNGVDTPVQVPYGAFVQLDWTSANVDSCQITPGNYTGLNGNQITGSLTQSTLITLTCLASGKTILDAVAVNVLKANVPFVDLKANGQDGLASVKQDDNLELRWTSQDATSCELMAGLQKLADGTSGTYSVPKPQRSEVYVLKCDGPGGTGLDFVTVKVLPDAVAAIILANGQAGGVTINYGDSAKISWVASNVDDCEVMPGNKKGTSGSFDTDPITTKTTYSLSCHAVGGDVTASVVVDVAQGGAVAANISANGVTGQANVPYGGSVTITWNSLNASACNVLPLNSTGTSGSSKVDNVTATMTYTLTCQGKQGSATASVTVNVGKPQAPVVDIQANGTQSPLTLPYDSMVTISWIVTNATSCELNGQPITSAKGSLNGQQVFTHLKADANYYLSCTGPGGTSGDRVWVYILPSGKPATMVGVNFEDLAHGSRDGDFNDVVLCFNGGFVVAGNAVYSTKSQTVRITTSHISACKHEVRVKVLHPDGTSEPEKLFYSKDKPTFDLVFKERSQLSVKVKSVYGGCPTAEHSMSDPVWAIVKANECRTTGR